MEQVAQQIEGLTLYFPVKASERGKLFGSVTTQEIAERLKEEIGLEIDPRRVGDNPLRELGKFDVPVRLETGLVANVRVVVHREDEDPRQAEQAEAEAESEDVAAQPEAELAETAEAAADEAPAEEAAEEA